MDIVGFFDLYGGLYMNIPLTDIHVSGPAILIINQLHWCLLKLIYLSKVTSRKLSIILSMGEM